MNAITLDHEKNPNLRLHIDSFILPQEGRLAFEETMRQSHETIEVSPGYRGYLILEKLAKASGPALEIVSIVAWENEETFENASETMSAQYRKIGLDESIVPRRFTTFAQTASQAASTALEGASQLTIDLDADPGLHCCLERFFIPELARAEFEEAMKRSLSFIEKQPGYRGYAVLEKPGGPTTIDLVWLVAWDGGEALEAALETVLAHDREIGFDLPTILSRWGVRAEIGNYRRLQETR